MPLVTAIFRGILRAFRGDLSLAPACRRMVQCGAAVVFAAAAPGALPASAQSDPFAQPGGVSKPSAPIILNSRDYVAAPDAEYRNFTIKWARPANSGGGRILEYRITRSKAPLSGRQDPARCDLLSEPGNHSIRYAADSFEAFRGPDVFELSDGTNISHGNCVRWHISARNAAGWGPAAATNPLLTRHGNTDRCDVNPAQAPTIPVGLDSAVTCPATASLENSDWCKRAGGALIWRKSEESNDPNFYLVCNFPGNVKHKCDSRYPRPRHDSVSDVTSCGIGGLETYCGSYSVYNVRHRECICTRLAVVKSVTHKTGNTPANIAGVQTCGCDSGVANPIAGIETVGTGACRCPAGKTYYPDTHACETTRPAVETNFDVNLVAGGEKTTADGVVEINHTRSVSFSMSVNVPSSLPSGSRPGSFTVRVGDSAAALCTGSLTQSGESGGKRHFAGNCSAQIQAGKHDIAAKFRVSGRDIQAPLKVHVGTDRQGECERKNPAVNPVGGRYEPGDGTCELDREAFYKTLGDPAQGNVPRCFTDTDHASVPTNCVRHYAELRAAGCNPPETLHKQGSANHLPSVNPLSDYSCVCADTGEATRADGSCYSDEEKALVAEFEREPLDLVSVVALLDQGVNPNLTSGGIPLLFVAATLGDAEAVSILITAGVDPNTQIRNPTGGDDYLPEYLGRNGLTGTPASAEPILPWRSAASVLIYFGDAARLSTVTYDWARGRGRRRKTNIPRWNTCAIAMTSSVPSLIRRKTGRRRS